MSEQTEPPTLLRVPREIRDLIYCYLLDEYTEPPPNPSFPGDRLTGEDVVGDSITRKLSINYSKNPPSCQHVALLSTSRQLHAEVLDIIDKRLASGTTSAELDLMAKGYQIWPTWTISPSFANRAAGDTRHRKGINANVNLRIFSTEGFRSNDGWPRQPGSNFRDLFELIKRFIEFGPSFGPTTPMSKKTYLRQWPDSEHRVCFNSTMFKINTLYVNVAFHDIYTRATHPETVRSIFAALKKLAMSGYFGLRIERIRCYAKFMQNGKVVESQNEWVVNRRLCFDTLEEWKQLGLIQFE